MLVADQFLDIAGDHAGEHHAEGHESGADGVMGGLLRTFAEEHHEVGEGRETESVTELFDGNGRGYGKQVFGLADSQINEGQTRQRHTSRHPPNGFL